MFTLIPSPTCPRCQRPVLEDAEQIVCDGCLATHHERCWHQGEGCSALRPQTPQGPPPAERPPKIRVARASRAPRARRGAVVGTSRRRNLVQSLAVREAAEEEHEEVEHEEEFRAFGIRPEPGDEQTCRKCQKAFVITDPFEARCSRCVHATYWKIGIVFAVIVIWKLIF